MVASTGPLEYPKAIGETMKHCTECNTAKSLSEFHNNRSAKDGKAQYCKPCWNAYMRVQAERHRDRKAASDARWLEANRDRKLAQQLAWRKANADRIKERNAAYRAANREAIQSKAREYTERTREERKAKYHANPEAAKARARAWTAANMESVKERNRKWRAANPDRYRETMRLAAARRRARKAELPTYDITAKDMRRLLTSPCSVAGCDRTDIQIDHVIPVARGGSHGVGNFQSLCSSHNQSKGKRTWIEFRVYLALKAQLAA